MISFFGRVIALLGFLAGVVLVTWFQFATDRLKSDEPSSGMFVVIAIMFVGLFLALNFKDAPPR